MKRLAFIACAVLLAAVAATAQEHPNHARGFAPESSFENGDVDAINLFNGNVNLAIPIGRPMHVGGTLGYEFTLTWAANSWTYHAREADDCDTPCQQYFYHAQPDARSNAGLGWLLSLGHLVLAPAGPPPAYVSPDGGSHAFLPTLHDGETQDANVWYTRDGTYLRMKRLTLQTPNDTYEIEFPDGTIKKFSAGTGRLQEIRDRFGNAVTVTYGTATDGAPVWTLTDTHSRTSTVTFARLTNAAPGVSDAAYYDVVKTITMPSFTGQPAATYTLHYGTATTGDALSQISRPYVPDFDSTVSRTVWVPLLTSVDLADGTTFKFKKSDGTPNYDVGDAQNLSDPAQGSFTGHILGATLPTRGSIEWDWQRYSYPSASATSTLLPFAFARSTGVKERRMRLPNNTIAAKTVYSTANSTSLKTLINTAVRMDGADVLAKTVRYFSTCNGTDPSCPAGQYGLPVTLETNPDGAGPAEIPTFSGIGALSAKFHDGNGVLLRSRYLKHAMESGFNRRVMYEKTVYHDDGDKWTTAESSEFDGLGHYRRVTLDGDVDESPQRLVKTAYNQKDPNVDPNGRDVGELGTAGYQMLTKNDPWVLGTFSSQEIIEGEHAIRSLYCFDASTGFLLRTRTMAGGLPAGHDFVARFTADAGGQVSREEYFGGDAQAVPATPLCGATLPSSAAYRLDHTYDYGIRKTSTYWDFAAGAPMTFKVLDRTVDAAGLVSKTRDTAGVETTYSYDSSGRVRTIQPAGALGTTITYTNATASVGATVEALQSSTASGTLRNKIEVDGLGRVAREERTGPGGTTLLRFTAYGSSGLLASVSTFGGGANDLFEFADYDPFGRPGKITGPDGGESKFSYQGIRTRSRSVRIGTAFTSPSTVQQTWAVTNETYDRYGRLVRVVEPDSNSTTGYTYDAGSRLASVSIEAQGVTQTRSFTYDGRGVLTQETQPETGTITYGGYDAMGRPTRKRLASAGIFDLDVAYDSAGRAKTIDSRNPYAPTAFRRSKEFVFADQNSGTDLKRGKLEKAIRHNYHPSMGDFIVTETYSYRDTAGRPTDRMTEIHLGSTLVKRLTQTFAYNELGMLAELGYPVCLGAGCGEPQWDAVKRDFSSGAISAIKALRKDAGGATIATYDFATSIAYAPSGMVTEIVHGNDIVETITPDGVLPRPRSIEFGPWSGCTKPSIVVEPADQNIGVNESTELRVVPSGTAPFSYQWREEDGTPVPGATSSTFPTGALAQTKRYYVTITNGCGFANSRVAVVTVTACTKPVITLHPQSTMIASGDSVQLSAAANGDAPLTYQWYRGSGTGMPVGTGSSFPTPQLYSTTTYWVRVSNSCGSADSNPATIVVPLSAPANLVAAPAGPDKIAITWSPSNGASWYEVERRSAGSPFQKIQDVPGTVFYDDNRVSNVTYVYRVRAIDAAGGSVSPYSSNDLATLLTLPSAQPGVTIGAGYFHDALAAVNMVRAASGAPPLAWSEILPAGVPVPAAGVPIMAAHLTALRTRMDAALQSAQCATHPYVDPGVVPGETAIRAVHLQQIQERTQ